MGIRNPEITTLVNNVQKSDIETILQTNDLNLYQFELCCNISLEYTANFLENHPDIVNNIKKLFEDNDSYYLQKNLTAKIAKEKEQNIFERVIKCEEIAEDKYSREDTYRYHDIDPYIQGVGYKEYRKYFERRCTAAEKLDSLFNFDKAVQQTEKRIKKSSGEECFRILTTPIEDIKEYNEAKKLQAVLEKYYDQTSFLAERTGFNTDLYYTYLNADSAFSYVPGALDMLGKYRSQPKIEQLYEEKLRSLISMKTINESDRHFNCFSRAGINHFSKKMTETILKDPSSEDSKFYIQLGKEIYRKQEFLLYGKEPITSLATTLAKKHPDIAIEFLKLYLSEYKFEDIEKLYEKNKALLPIVIEKLESYQDKNGTYTPSNKIRAHNYWLQTKDPKLKAIARAPLPTTITVDSNLISLSKNSDYAPIFEDLKNAQIDSLKVNLNDFEPSDFDTLQKILQNYPNLKTIDFIGTTSKKKQYNIDAKILLSNKNLEHIKFGENITVDNAEILLKDFPNLTTIEKCNNTTFNNSAIFWQTLREHKPQQLENIIKVTQNDISKEELKAIMNQYPDLYIEHNISTLQKMSDRNQAIINAKKSKNLEDIRWVAITGGIIEYLKLIDKKDRPSFDDLNQKIETNYSDDSCFDEMRDEYGNKYFETLTEVADLCGFTEIKEEAELLSAVQDKRIVEYLKSQKPEDIPPFTRLSQKTVGTEKGDSILTYIKKRYSKEEYPTVLAEVLTLTKATEKDLQSLENDKDFGTIVKQYAERQKLDKQAKATKSAFEQWKKQQSGKEV